MLKKIIIVILVVCPLNQIYPEGKKRGDVYILVYRINKNPEAVVQINFGYPYDKVEETVNVKIDEKNYEFYADGR